jgi:hypothetical protein
MRERDGYTHILWLVAGGLFLYCLVLTVVTGDIGFEGDDWWIFSWPFTFGFPKSLWVYAKESLRPVEGMYWIGLYELAGLNKPIFHLFSQLLLAGAAVLMGACLHKAFPERRLLVTVAALLAFFLPTVSCLTYVVTTDNSRLSLLLFWLAVLKFQDWADGSLSWRGLAKPVAIYLAAFMTYEAPTFLIFAVPFLVWPIHMRHRDRISDRAFLLRVGTGICVAFGLAVATRFAFLSGGAVGHRHLLPPWDLLWSYPALLPFYLAAPFTDIAPAGWAWILGTAAAIGTAALIFFTGRVQEGQASPSEQGFPHEGWYIVLTAMAIVLLGMLPYQLAGYGSVTPTLVDTAQIKWGLTPGGETSWFNFNWSSRIYSAGTYGLAILLAALLTFWKRPAFSFIGKAAAVGCMLMMVVFHAGLSLDWREAAVIRNELTQSLVSQVPDVKSDTGFVFLNLDSRHKRAAVFRGWMGLRSLVRMLYDDPSLNAWYLYPHAWKWPNEVHQQGFVLPKGFVSRGMKMNAPFPHGNLLVFNRVGNKLELIDKISPKDGLSPTGIAWRGGDALASNPSRIVAWSDITIDPRRRVHNSWTNGLISTLHLSRLHLARSVLNKWAYALQRGGMYKSALSKAR